MSHMQGPPGMGPVMVLSESRHIVCCLSVGRDAVKEGARMSFLDPANKADPPLLAILSFV